MASLIPGYNYDIFISYRQKDNKHDGWVTEFVDNLKGELESTFKEEISVYFDINPHDGLLETHDVDASLTDKLKCLVFIPIISRTYCDPKSFAWEHEFKAFIELASNDQFGLRVRLPNGNVACRVLPIQIHDLNPDDKELVENELGGYLRPVEFIYKEPGVNRPLKPDDDEKVNLTKTKYRNQINKVANAIDEIINSILNLRSTHLNERPEKPGTSEKIKIGERREKKKVPLIFNKHKLLSGVVILTVLIIAVIVAYPRIFKLDTLGKMRSSGERISIAVLPFQNMTNDTTLDYLKTGIQFNLIASMSNYPEELRVTQPEIINRFLQDKQIADYASISPSFFNSLAKNLETKTFICGNIIGEESNIRLTAQLINSETEEVFKSFRVEGAAGKILSAIDSLSNELLDYLLITKLNKEVPQSLQKIVTTNSPEAYRCFINGVNSFYSLDYAAATHLLLRAVEIDTNFTAAIFYLSVAYGSQELIEQGKKWCLKAFYKKDQMPLHLKSYTNWLYARYFETPYQEIKSMKEILKIDDKSPFAHYEIGNGYQDLNLHEKAIPYYEKALAIYKSWNQKPLWFYYYVNLGRAYHNTGQYRKENELYNRAELDFPDNLQIISRQAILALTEKDSIKANKFMDKIILISRENSVPEANIYSGLAEIYSEADILNIAGEYYRKAFSLEPENPLKLNDLAFFLIDKNQSLDEGMELIYKALELNPGDFHLIYTKGWGLYKQGKYEEALQLLEKSWEIRTIDDHIMYSRIEAAKKAIAIQE